MRELSLSKKRLSTDSLQELNFKLAPWCDMGDGETHDSQALLGSPKSQCSHPRFAKVLCSLAQCVSIPGLQLTEIALANSSTRGFYWKAVGALKQSLEETGWKIKGPRVALWSWDAEMQMCFLTGTF